MSREEIEIGRALSALSQRRATLEQIVTRMVAGSPVSEYELPAAMNELQAAAVDVHLERTRTRTVADFF